MTRARQDDGANDAPLFTRFHEPADVVARRLLGQRLVRVREGERLAGLIVEVEAYLGPQDRASHSHGGRRTARNASMFLPGGHAYVYFVYGMHHCFNVVTGAEDEGAAVLVRALEPVEGVATMRSLRPAARDERLLCSGPGNLARALDIDRSLDGAPLARASGLFIEEAEEATPGVVVVTPRVGVAYAGEWAGRPLRFFLEGSASVSRRRG